MMISENRKLVKENAKEMNMKEKKLKN